MGMGHYTRVTQAIRHVSRGSARKLAELKRKLAEFETIAFV